MGLPEFKTKDLVSMFEERVNNQFDVIPLLDGGRGLGKSTGLFKILTQLKNIQMPFKPRKDIIFSKDQIIQQLATKTQGCIDADELINCAYNRDFWDEAQKTLIKGLNMYRDKGNICGGCVPFFYDLDTQLRKLCSIRITLIRRGIALIHLPHKTIYTNDPWDTKNNAKIEVEWLKKKSKPKYHKLTTVVGIWRFNDITKNQRELYLEIKEEKRNRIYGQLDDNILDPDQLFYKNLLGRLKEGNITLNTFDEVCLINSRKRRSVQRTLNNMLKDKGDNRTFKDLLAQHKKKQIKPLLEANKVKV